MSNGGGNVCTPEEAPLYQQNHSSLHYYTRGEKTGLLLVVIINLFLLASLLYVFTLVARNVKRHQRTGRRLISQPTDVFMLSLLASHFVLSIEGSINAIYLYHGKFQVGTICQAQTVFFSVGTVTQVVIAPVIMIYTSSMFWWRTGNGSVLFAWLIVGVIWTYNILYNTIMPRHHNSGKFCHPLSVQVQQIFEEYTWTWWSCDLLFLLNISSLLWSRWYLSPDMWWYHIHTGLPRSRALDRAVEWPRSMVMHTCPGLCAFFVMWYWIFRSGLSILVDQYTNTSSLAVSLLGRVFLGLSGICNMLVFLIIWPNLIASPCDFSEPPPPIPNLDKLGIKRSPENVHPDQPDVPAWLENLKLSQTQRPEATGTHPSLTIDRTCAQPAADLMPPDPPSTPEKSLINKASSSPAMFSTPANHSAKNARLIVPQVALEHAIAHESSVRKALEAACAATDAAYIIQVGFNEDMLQSNQGALQEIYILLNFDIQPNNESQVLDQLSRILSPFPCTVYTPSADLPLSIVGQDGNLLASKEMWAVFRNRGIFIPHNNLQVDNHSYPVSSEEALSTRVIQANDKTSTSASGNFSQSGGGGSASGHADGASGKSSHGQSPLMPGNDRDSNSGSDAEPPERGTFPSTEHKLPATLEVPLQTCLEIAWSQVPEASQKFSTTSRLFVIVENAATSYTPYDDAQVNSGFGPYPSPTVNARFVHLHVHTTNQPESQARYELHLACVRMSATLRSNTLAWSPRTTPGSSNTVRKAQTTSKSLGASLNVTQHPIVSVFHSRGSTSRTEREESVCGIVVESGFTDDTSFVRWTCDVNDPKERTSGREFQCPRVKFAFWKPSERPRIGVRLIVTWSLAMPPKKSWPIFFKKTRPLPVFRTFLQDVSASLQLDGLAEPSRIGDPMLSAIATAPQNLSGPSTAHRNPPAPSTAPQQPPTSQTAPQNTSTLSSGLQNPSEAPNPLSPSEPRDSSTLSITPHNLSAPGQRSMGTGMNLQAQAAAMRPALNNVGAEVPDVKAVFKSALYGCIRDTQNTPQDIH